MIGASEAETIWTDFLRKLTLHGPLGVKLVDPGRERRLDV